MSESAFPNTNINKNGQFMDGNPKLTKSEAIQDDAVLKDSGPLFNHHQISRPPLQRVDSRPNFHPRSGFLPRFPSQAFPLNQRPIFRPQSPFFGGRPQVLLTQSRPQFLQQNSLPAFRPRPFFEETFNRAQTLDSSELLEAHNNEHKANNAQKMPSVASLGKTINSNNALENSSSRENSVENLTAFSSDRESQRSISPKMDKIEEIDKVHNNKENMDKLPSSNKEIIPSTTPTESPKSIVINIKENSNLNLELNTKKEVDNDDSGVDESTQGNNEKTCNGESPKKASNKLRTSSSSTPIKNRTSLSHHGSKTPSSTLQSPDSAVTTPGSIENKKKIPMNKIQVGAAPSPNLKVVKSKIGSLNNTSYKPGGGKVKIENKKLDFKGAAGSKIEAKNDKYFPKGGEKKEIHSARSVVTSSARKNSSSSISPRKILTQKLEWNAKSKIGSLENATYKPKGGDKKIESVKLNFKGKAASKVGSRENMKYQPGGGDVRIENKKIELNVTSKIGSFDNVKHKPAGGDKKIFDDKDYLKQQQKSGKSSMNQSLSGSQHSIQSQESKAPVADENLNQKH